MQNFKKLKKNMDSKKVQERIKKELDTSIKKNAKYDLTHMQWQMKTNSEDIQSFVHDLNSWEKEIAKKDKNKNSRDKAKVSLISKDLI